MSNYDWVALMPHLERLRFNEIYWLDVPSGVPPEVFRRRLIAMIHHHKPCICRGYRLSTTVDSDGTVGVFLAKDPKCIS